MTEMKAKVDRWREVKILSDKDAEAQLSGEELEAHKSYHANFKEDLEKTKELVGMMMKDLDPPKVKPKGIKQKKRDKWARIQGYSHS